MNTMELAMQSPFNFVTLLRCNKISKEDFLQTRIWEQEDKREFFKEVLKTAGSVIFWLNEEDLTRWKFENFKLVFEVEYQNNMDIFRSYSETVEFLIKGAVPISEFLNVWERIVSKYGGVSLHLPEPIENAVRLYNYTSSLVLESPNEIKDKFLDRLIWEYKDETQFILAVINGRVNITFSAFVERIKILYKYDSFEKIAHNMQDSFYRQGYDLRKATKIIKEATADWDDKTFDQYWDVSVNYSLSYYSHPDQYTREIELEPTIVAITKECARKNLSEYQDVLEHILFPEGIPFEGFLEAISSYFFAINTCVVPLRNDPVLFNAHAINKRYPEFSFEKKMAVFLSAAGKTTLQIQKPSFEGAMEIFTGSNQHTFGIETFNAILTEYWALPNFSENCLNSILSLTNLIEKGSPVMAVVSVFSTLQRLWTGKRKEELLNTVENFFGREIFVEFKSEEFNHSMWLTTRRVIDSFVFNETRKDGQYSTVMDYLDGLPVIYKEKITSRHKEANKEVGFKTDPLKALQAIVYEYVFIKEALFNVHTPDQCHKVATEVATSIRGGFDSFNIVGNRAALLYFASKRVESNLFACPKKVKRELFMLDMNKEGIPGLEQVNPFERGFSWSNYDEICALAQINPYGRKNAAKRFACYLLTALFRDDPEVVNTKFKEAGFAEGVKDVVDAIAQIVPHTDLLSNNPPLSLKAIFENRDAWCEYWANKHEHIKLICAFNSVYSNSGKILAPNVLTQMAEVVQSFKNQGLDKYMDELFVHINEVNITLKNGTTIQTISDALDFVRRNNTPEEKRITIEKISIPDEDVTARILDAGDLRALTIGEEVSCCQHIRGHARTCAEETYTNPDYCVMIVEDTSKAEPTIPIAESAIWLGEHDSKQVIVIDSIESRRSDSSAVTKVGKAFEVAIKHWISQGKEVAISKTNYGMTSQVRSWLEQMFTLEEQVAPATNAGVYSDLGSFCYYLYEN